MYDNKNMLNRIKKYTPYIILAVALIILLAVTNTEKPKEGTPPAGFTTSTGEQSVVTTYPLDQTPGDTISSVEETHQNLEKVGQENIWSLMNVRECDRVGMKKKEAPYRLRKYFAMIEEALRDPISVGQLKIDGEFMIKELGIKPGPRMGWILSALLEEVLNTPNRNTVEELSKLVESLNLLGDKELKALGDKGKEKKEELEEEEIAKLHQKHGVRIN